MTLLKDILLSSEVLIIAGPTASGKSALAIELAQHKRGMILNADSMQVYKEIPILTAQPNEVEKKEIPHYLYGHHSLPDAYSVGVWLREVTHAIDKALEKDLFPIVVGGTGLYLKALLEGVSPIPEVSLAAKERALKTLEAKGLEGMLQKVKETDPLLAAVLKPGDTQRLLRAYTVWLETGKPLSYFQSLKPTPLPYVFKTLLLMPPKEELYPLINWRFEKMVEGGGLQEVEALLPLEKYGPSSGLKAVGLRELAMAIKGDIALRDAISKAQQLTRNYAKRQMTWFRHQLTADLVLEEIWQVSKGSKTKSPF